MKVKDQLDEYAACQKAGCFLARSLRYAQTPHNASALEKVILDDRFERVFLGSTRINCE